MILLVMVLNILQIGAPELTKKSKAIKDFRASKLQKLINDMIDTCEADRAGTAGLAAPQVGENIRLTVIRRLDLEKKIKNRNHKRKDKTKIEEIKLDELWEAVINPEIVYLDEEHESLIWEACLSVGKGKQQLWGPVWRPDKVEIKYFDRHGKPKQLKASGFFSHLIQHEIDHLDGKLFISRVKNPALNLWLSGELDDYIEKNKAYPAEK